MTCSGLAVGSAPSVMCKRTSSSVYLKPIQRTLRHLFCLVSDGPLHRLPGIPQWKGIKHLAYLRGPSFGVFFRVKILMYVPEPGMSEWGALKFCLVIAKYGGRPAVLSWLTVPNARARNTSLTIPILSVESLRLIGKSSRSRCLRVWSGNHACIWQ